jgi:restriction endonuclease S subunit
LEDRIDCEYNYKHFYQLKDNFEKRGLKVVRFGKLIKKKLSEPQTNSEDFVSEGIPVLRITDIYEDYLDFENCARIPEEIYEKLKEFQLISNDIIFGLSGTIGRTIVVPENIPEKAITNRRIAKVTLKDPQLSYYIAAFLNSEFGKMQLLRETTGGVQKNLRLEDITKVHIPIPSKELIYKFSSLMKERIKKLNDSRILIQEAKQDVEDLIEGNFSISKIKANN